jgi:hypothetical protein
MKKNILLVILAISFSILYAADPRPVVDNAELRQLCEILGYNYNAIMESRAIPDDIHARIGAVVTESEKKIRILTSFGQGTEGSAAIRKVFEDALLVPMAPTVPTVSTATQCTNKDLKLASAQGEAEKVRTILAAKQNPVDKAIFVCKVKGNLTALHLAAMNGHANIVKLLLAAVPIPMEKAAFVHLESDAGKTALDYADEKKFMATVAILEQIPVPGPRALYDAVEAGDFLAMHLLLKRAREERKNFLRWEDADGNTVFHKAIAAGRPDIAESLIWSLPGEKHSITGYLHKKNRRGQSPLELISPADREEIHTIIEDAEIPIGKGRIRRAFGRLGERKERARRRTIPLH